MNAKEYISQYKTDNQNGMISYDSIIELMEGYSKHRETLNNIPSSASIIESALTESQEYDKKALQAAKDNHIWLNAMNCVRPTDEFLISIGKTILSKLSKRDNLMPSDGITSNNESIRELAKLTPILYMSINKS